MTAYITATGSHLPGHPLADHEIEDYIGKTGRATSDLKRDKFADCGIKSRVRTAADRAGPGPDHVELLCAATTIGDLIAPDHASIAGGELGYGPPEISSLPVAIGENRAATSAASEFPSRTFKKRTSGSPRCSPRLARACWPPRATDPTHSPTVRAYVGDRQSVSAPCAAAINVRCGFAIVTLVRAVANLTGARNLRQIDVDVKEMS